MADEPRTHVETRLTGADAENFGLHSLAPAKGARRDRKRIGRGHGSGHGKTSGRGHKGAGARAGSKDRVHFEGGQNPLHMRMRKLRGPNKKMSMPFEPFRTHTQHVNLDDLELRFDDGAAVDLDALKRTGLAKQRDVPVKILGRGELSKKLTVHAHRFSKSARERIESAGGTCQVIEP
jgi:large subunit ribosomal protein L15